MNGPGTPAGPAPGGERARPRILLVEDNEMNRDMLSRRLRRRGYEVVVAVDGRQGVAMAVSEAPALILMDMSLPELDGWEATRRIKADPASSPALAAAIVEGGTEDPLRSHRREITVVFLDLRGFTAFAETAEPEELMGLLGEFHAEMGRLVLAHESASPGTA
jgi:CheY-like chemotaxis protein